MIESESRTRRHRPQQPLPRLSCEHVVQGYSTVAQIIRDGVLLSVYNQCWTRQDLLQVTMEGKVIAPTDETAWTSNRMATVKQIAGYDGDRQ